MSAKESPPVRIVRPVSILFRCDAGPIHGFGHVSRCAILADAFKAAGLGHPIFRTFSSDGAGRKFLVDRGFAVENAPEATGGSDDLESLLARLANLPAPRLLVVDSKNVDRQYCETCRSSAVVLCIDDEICRELACDILVNNHPWISSADYAPLPNRHLLIGPSYNILPQAIFGNNSRETAYPVKRILITLGGEDPHDHTSWIVDSCADILATYDIDIVIGPAHPDPGAVKTAVARCLPAANVEVAPSSLDHLIARADLAVSAGGITCYELAAARVPTLAITVEDHQEPLIMSLERHGSLARLGGYGDLHPAKVREMLSMFLGDSDRLRRMAKAASTLFRSAGAPAIVACAAKLVEQRFGEEALS